MRRLNPNQDRKAAAALLTAAAICLAATGAILWLNTAPAIFNQIVTAQLSGCF